MRILIIDANILFSALIKNSVTAKLIFEEEFLLYTPEFIIEEFLKYQEMITMKTSRSKEEFIQIMHMLKDIIIIIPQEEYASFTQEAKNISPDSNDILYFALALKLNSGIWSNDKRLKMQNKVNIYSTEELLTDMK